MINPEYALKETIKHIIGLQKGCDPLGGKTIEKGGSDTQNRIFHFFQAIVSEKNCAADNFLFALFDSFRSDFISFYSDEKKNIFLAERMEVIKNTDDVNARAKAVAEIWAPEIAIPNSDILPKWRLSNVKANPKPYLPEEIVLQLNSLYTLPEKVPARLPQSIQEEWDRVQAITDEKVFDYDHPVFLFSDDKNHELVTCLDELDIEIGFEKEQGVFARDYKVPVVISISVTHPSIDHLCGLWLQHILKEKYYHNLFLYIVTEEATKMIKDRIGFTPQERSIFSVSGKYANHFNVLKYFQLLLERTVGIRAGFKIDTDEGIRSRDLYAATGRTWFQTMCHEYWGGIARDDLGKQVYLGIIEGEYVNEKDIQAFGYRNCLRMPDVSFNGNYQGPEIFFRKGIAHAKATALYNQKGDRLETFLSHPVVKGGGYGIDNSALRKFTPFSFSEVGRAEDQQFYMAGLARGNRGIFTPDLRIAHYKQSVAATEKETEITRFLGDMFRLVIFQEIAGFLDIKEKIDPMPGVFAGGLARIQAFFSILYRSYLYCSNEEVEKGDLLFERGLSELEDLIHEIDSGRIRIRWDIEQKDWYDFVNIVDSCDQELLREIVQVTEVQAT